LWPFPGGNFEGAKLQIEAKRKRNRLSNRLGGEGEGGKGDGQEGNAGTKADLGPGMTSHMSQRQREDDRRLAGGGQKERDMERH